MESTRKRVGFLGGVEKSDDARKGAVKAYKAEAEVADAAGARALGTGAPEDHRAASAAARAAATSADRAYYTGRGSRASNESLHDGKKKYGSDADLHDRAAAGDRGALGLLHGAAARAAQWDKRPADEARHAAAAVNAHLDDRDGHAADAEAARDKADGHESAARASGEPFGRESNFALQARNAARASQGRADTARDAAERAAKDHAGALAGRHRDERGRFAGA